MPVPTMAVIYIHVFVCVCVCVCVCVSMCVFVGDGYSSKTNFLEKRNRREQENRCLLDKKPRKTYSYLRVAAAAERESPVAHCWLSYIYTYVCVCVCQCVYDEGR